MSFANVLYTVILYPLVQVIELVFFLFNKLFDNVGIATLGVSLCVTLLCLPLYVVAEGWQEDERKIQSRLAPQIARIKRCFNRNPPLHLRDKGSQEGSHRVPQLL